MATSGEGGLMYKYNLYFLGSKLLSGKYVPEGVWIDLGVRYSKDKPEPFFSDSGLKGYTQTDFYATLNVVWEAAE